MSLPALSRADRLLLSIVLLAAVLVALVAWLLLPPEKTGGMEQQPSTFFNVGYGTKAAYQVLDRLGLSRHPAAPADRAGDAGGDRRAVCPRTPGSGWTSDELAALEDWIKEGHALVVVPGASRASALSSGSRLEDWFHLTSSPASDRPRGGRSAPAPRAERDRHGRDRQEGDRAAEPRPIRSWRGSASWWPAATSGSTRASPLARALGRACPCTPSGRTSAGIVGLRAEFGDGTIVALADTYPLSNLGISEADNGLLLANMVRELSEQLSGTGCLRRIPSRLSAARLVVAGDGETGAGRRLALGGGPGGCWWASWRCTPGPCASAARRMSRRTPRRQHREFAEAAGRLLNEAGATVAGRRDALSPLPRPALPGGGSRTGGRRPAAQPGGSRSLRAARSSACSRQAQHATAAGAGRQKLLPLPRNFIALWRHSIMELEAVTRTAEAVRRELSQGDRRPGRRPGSDRGRPAGRRARPAGRAAGHGEDAAGAGLGAGHPRRVPPHPVHARPDAGRHHRREHLPRRIRRPSNFRPGPVFCDLLLADEINRAPAKTQSALLEAMQEQQVSVDREVHPLSPVFTAFATQNPIEYEGTYPAARGPTGPLPVEDRGRLSRTSSRRCEILERYQAGFDAARLATFGVEPCTSVEELAEVRAAVRQVTVAPPVMEYVASIIRATRGLPWLTLGASPRAAVMLFLASKGLAVLRGRDPTSRRTTCATWRPRSFATASC